jgi:hypothetical protein
MAHRKKIKKPILSKKHRRIFDEWFYSKSMGTWLIPNVMVLPEAKAKRLFALGIKIGRSERKRFHKK